MILNSEKDQMFEEHMFEEQTFKEHISAELAMAAELQASMIPSIFPPFPDKTEFDIYASMSSAQKVGGDFYDFFLISKSKLAVVIADVSGKGIAAALFMAITKTLIKNNARAGKSPAEVFRIVNSMLFEDSYTGMFVTAFMGYLDLTSGHFVFVNAGHNPPVIRKSTGHQKILKVNTNLVLACMENTEYNEEEIILEKGDLLFLYTDGITEARNSAREFFSEKRLLKVLKKNGGKMPKDLLDAMKKEIDGFTGTAEQEDDITMLAMKINHFAEPVVQEITVEANPENINKLISFINEELLLFDCPSTMQGYIDLAVEEIFVNITKHAYKGKKGYVKIRIEGGDEVAIRFEDSGSPYNPFKQTLLDFYKPIENRKISNFGLFLARQLIDNLHYERLNNRNILTIYKRIKIIT
jgi:sigma-B regulation protein RsbU (phosphoserine phosphatase)